MFLDWKESDEKEQTAKQYPLRCTGIASVSLVLRRQPKNSETLPKLLIDKNKLFYS